MSGNLTLQSTYKLHNGNEIPSLGFGTGDPKGVYKSERSICERSIATAIEVGYRHIDCAQFYGNEDLVGKAATSNPKVPREELFLTTKIMNYSPGDTVEALLPSLQESVRKMHPGQEKPYVDLFLIHTPTMGPDGRLTLWKALIELQKLGQAKNIGVSNFGIKHLEALKETGVRPVVNQLELHPWCQQREIVKYCRENGIVLQAYSPLVRTKKNEDPVLNKIAKETGKEVAQVLIRWSLQKGFNPLPKSDTPSRIQSNADVFSFSLSDAQMKELDALGDSGDQPICPFNVNCP